MAQGKSSTIRIKTLYRSWSAPVIRALYEHDQHMAEAALAKARKQAETLSLNADEHCAAGCLLDYLEYTIHRALGLEPEQVKAFNELLTRLHQTEPLGEVSQTMRCVLLLIHRIRGERAGYGELPQLEFYALFNFVPPEARELELWHNVASWAFIHRDAPLLERAYEVFVIEPKSSGSQYPFYRVKLMNAIVHGRANKEELNNYIKRLASINAVNETRELLWPSLQEQGLIDNELDEALDAACERLKSQASHSAG